MKAPLVIFALFAVALSGAVGAWFYHEHLAPAPPAALSASPMPAPEAPPTPRGEGLAAAVADLELQVAVLRQQAMPAPDSPPPEPREDRSPKGEPERSAPDLKGRLAALEARVAHLEAQSRQTTAAVEQLDVAELQKRLQEEKARERRQELWRKDWKDLSADERREKRALMLEQWSENLDEQVRWLETSMELVLTDEERLKVRETIALQYAEQLDSQIDAAARGEAMTFEDARNQARESTFARLSTFLRADQVEAYREWLAGRYRNAPSPRDR